jgi:hypothetical protein
MMCLFFKFCQILKISNLLPARSLENPVKAQATPDCQRQFETDTHHQLCLDLGNSGKMGSKMPIRPISHPERDADPNERAVAHWPGAAENPDALGE